MEKGIDANIPLDYIEFQIFPSQNRYEACVCQGKTIETVTSALLEPLLLHSTTIKALHSEGFDAKYKLIAPEDGKGVRWFKKSTLIRFLQVIGASEVMNATNAVKNEMSQLVEARKFHLSLYSKGPQDHLESGKAGNSSDNASTPKAGIGSASSDDSKNELLRAIDLRLTALRGELATALTQSASATCSKEEMVDLEKFSHHFGATDLRDSLCKLMELSQEKKHADFRSDSQSPSKSDLERNWICKKQENNQNCQRPQSDTPVKYSASPAKAAQIERESSSESGESSCSSDEEEPSSERSRTLIRSASPTRSASPMRRVQIGRSGSRRSTALTIKSLNYFPRERSISQKDAATLSSDEEAAEQPSKRFESNVNRISVQDAISLFERKQKDEIVDIQKIRSSLNVKDGANKSVLRRWSAGAGEKFSEDPQSTSSNTAVPLLPSSLGSGEITNEFPKEKAEQDLPSNDSVQPAEVGIKPDSTEQRLLTQACIQENIICSQTAENSEKSTGSAEWSRQKGAELNQLLMKMMETKPVKYQTGATDNRKNQNLPNEKRGGLYDHYKEKRDEKFQRETVQKRAEKEKQFKAMQRVPDERKAEIASANGSDSGRKRNVKLQKSQKTSSLLANPKKEISKSSVVKKASSKASPLPATRKSWPTTPSPRPTGSSPAKTPPGTTSAVTTPTRKKLHPATSVPRLSPKVENTQPKPKSVKPTQNGTTTDVKDANAKQQPLKKSTKLVKPKLQSVDEDATSLAKPRFYSKVTKKSSIVPVESKSFLRKGSGIGSGAASRIKAPPQPEETLIITGDANRADKKKMVSSRSDQVIQQQEVALAKKDFTDMELNIQVNQEKCEDMGTPVEVAFTEDDGFQNIADSALDNDAAEESDIPPTAWEEIEEHEEQPAPCSNSVFQNESPSNVASVEISKIPSSRVRHSLSQMLLEESSEPDVIDWGNAENPPAMLYQKDAPKGLKRLLKFARKSKADTNPTGWSSPSVFSEGEDDADESKFVSRSSDNLLKKAALHAKDLEHQKASSHDRNLDPHGTFAEANTCKTIGHRLSEKLQEGQISAPVTSTKATRSFFSLSAFKGGKQSEMKFQ